MKSVVVTGSTRGIGRGLAENFLKRGCKVCVSGRGQEAVDKCVAELAAQFGADKVTGKSCDIARADEIQALWEHAKKVFGNVDVWINNAGMSLQRAMVWDLSNADIEKIVATNLTGLMLANRIVLSGFVQQGNGQIWNMEGYGSNGATQPGMMSYGATKRAVHYINRALRKEVAEHNKEHGTNIQVCILSPGIVVTDLLIGDYDTQSEQWKKVRKIFNILGDKVETVTPWLVDGVLASNKNGAEVAWLTGGKAFARFLKATFVKRDLFADMGI